MIALLALGLGAFAAEPPAPAPAARESALTTGTLTFTAGGREVPGTLVLPAGAGPFPAVLLLAGSGPTDRDWNSPLLPGREGAGRRLAEALAGQGFAVLRFDKAGSGANPGPPLTEWTLDTYRDEALAALARLRATPQVRADRVFVAGHSEGGLHATRLALAAPDQVAGVLYLSSASRSLADTMLTQLEHQLRNPQAGLSKAQADGEMASLRAALAELIAGRPVDPTRASALPPVQALIASMANPATLALTGPLLGFDNATEAARLTVPALVLSGGKDVQIDPVLDGQRLADTMRGAGRDVTLHLSPDADHLLQHEPKTMDALRADLVSVQNGYNADGRTLDDDALAAIVTWLRAR